LLLLGFLLKKRSERSKCPWKVDAVSQKNHPMSGKSCLKQQDIQWLAQTSIKTRCAKIRNAPDFVGKLNFPARNNCERNCAST
jgi:hypothetical protein